MVIEILLVFILLILVLKFWGSSLITLRQAQRRHYKEKVYGTLYRKLWDVQFLREKMKAIREGFRIEHDRIKEIINGCNTRLEMEQNKPATEQDQKTIENLKANIEKLKPDLEQLEKQMQGIDGQVEGQGGINESIDGFQTAIELLKEHRKKS